MINYKIVGAPNQKEPLFVLEKCIKAGEKYLKMHIDDIGSALISSRAYSVDKEDPDARVKTFLIWVTRDTFNIKAISGDHADEGWAETTIGAVFKGDKFTFDKFIYIGFRPTPKLANWKTPKEFHTMQKKLWKNFSSVYKSSLIKNT